MIKNSLLTFFTQIVVILSGVTSQYFISHYYSIEEFGTVQLMWAWLQLLDFLSFNALNFVVLKASSQKYPAFFKIANLYCFASTIIGSLIFLYIGIFIKPSLFEFFILFVIFFPFNSGINLSQFYYLGSKQYKSYALTVSFIQILSVCGQVLVIFTLREIFFVLLAPLLTTSLINSVQTIRIFKKLNEKPDKRTDTELLKYGFQITLINIIPAISQRIQYIILEGFSGTVLLAIYATANLFPQHLTKLTDSLLAPFRVYAGGISKERAIKTMQNSLILFVLFGFSIFVVSVLGVEIAIPLVFGEKYSNSIFYSQILFTAFIFQPFTANLYNILLLHNLKRIYIYLIVISSVVQILLYLLFIPFFSIEGLVVALVITQFLVFMFAVAWIFKQKRSETKTILLLNSHNIKILELNTIIIQNQFVGNNVLKIVEADYLLSSAYYPHWVRIVAFLSFTKFYAHSKQKLEAEKEC